MIAILSLTPPRLVLVVLDRPNVYLTGNCFAVESVCEEGGNCFGFPEIAQLVRYSGWVDIGIREIGLKTQVTYLGGSKLRYITEK